MKTIFIKAESKTDISPTIKKFKEYCNSKSISLKKIAIVTTAQYISQLSKVAKMLGCINAGQILGCDVSKPINIVSKVNAYLYIGTGNFHPIYLAYKTKKPVYKANPETTQIEKISQGQIKSLKNRERAAYLKFLMANKIGIIISIKPGQFNLSAALNLKKKLQHKSKEAYLFIADNIDIKEFENFDIDVWVNTACPRLSEDFLMLNINELDNNY